MPQTFHDHANNLYSAIGQPKITQETFWDIYLELLKRIWDEQDEELTNIIGSHQELEKTTSNEDMPLLPDMQPFRLGQRLNIGGSVNYIGGLDVSNGDPRPEYAPFTTDEEESDSNDADVDM